MVRYYITKDGQLTGRIEPTLEDAIDTIRQYQSKETHWIRSEYGYIKGIEVTVPYKK